MEQWKETLSSCQLGLQCSGCSCCLGECTEQLQPCLWLRGCAKLASPALLCASCCEASAALQTQLGLMGTYTLHLGLVHRRNVSVRLSPNLSCHFHALFGLAAIALSR